MAVYDGSPGSGYWALAEDGSKVWIGKPKTQNPTFLENPFTAEAMAGLTPTELAEFLYSSWDPSSFAANENEFWDAFLYGAGGAKENQYGQLMIPNNSGGYTVQLPTADYKQADGSTIWGNYGLPIDAEGNIVGNPSFTQQERSGSFLEEHPYLFPLIPAIPFAAGAAGVGSGAGASTGAAAGNSGFWSTLVANSPSLGQVTTNALINGTLSKLTGGDFGEGALMGAFGSFLPGGFAAAGFKPTDLVTRIGTPLVTSAVGTAMRGGSFEDFARNAGINLLTATLAQKTQLSKVFNEAKNTVANAIDNPSQFLGGGSGTQLNLGGNGYDDLDSLSGWSGEYDSYNPGFDDVNRPSLVLDVNGATPPVEMGWGGEYDSYTPTFDIGGNSVDTSYTAPGWEGTTDYEWGQETIDNGAEGVLDAGYQYDDPGSFDPNAPGFQDPLNDSDKGPDLGMGTGSGSGSGSGGGTPKLPSNDKPPASSSSGLNSLLPIGLVALALAAARNSKSAKKENVRYAMPTMGAYELPKTYTVGPRLPKYTTG